MLLLSPSTSISLSPLLTLQGCSRAGEATSWAIPELRWIFDCGAVVSTKPASHIFITHTHSDHVQLLPNLLLNNNRTVQKHLYVPKTAAPFVQAYLDAYQQMIQCDDSTVSTPNELSYKLRALEPNQEFQVKHRNQIYSIRCLNCQHRVTCYGYSVVHQTSTLKPEFRGNLTSIKQLRHDGIETHDIVREPLVCILGDTTHVVFETYPTLARNHPMIVVECSFLVDADLDHARETQHMHWNHLAPIVQAHPQTLFCLTHFSNKYSNLFVRKFFENVTNVHPMIRQESVLREWEHSKDEKTVDVPVCKCFKCQNDCR
jgi:ribonuclease Z